MVLVIRGLSGSIAARLGEPLEELEAAMGSVERGALDVTLGFAGRDEIARVGRSFNAMVGGLKEREFLERAFGRYVAPAVLTALRDQRRLTIAAERRDATVLYAD